MSDARSSDNLITILSDDSNLTALVGSRISVGSAPQSATMPFVVVTLMATDELQVLNGTIGTRILNYDIDVVSQRSVVAENVSSAVRAALENYTGTVNGDTIHMVNVFSESCKYDSPQSGEDIGTYTATVEVAIQYAPA